jgi:hypothetical protein
MTVLEIADYRQTHANGLIDVEATAEFIKRSVKTLELATSSEINFKLSAA